MKQITSKTYFFLVLAFLILGFAIFYPQKYITVDEHNYIGNSYHLMNSSLRQECDRDNLPGQFEVKNYCIYKYNIGTSIILIPFLLISENLVFLASLISMVLSVIIFYKILKLLRIDQRLIFLFALYPTFIFISRTALSEGFSMLFMLLSVYIMLMIEKRKADDKLQFVYNNSMHYIFLGASVGAAVLIRYTNILPLGILLIFHILQNTKFKPINLKRITSNAVYIFIGSIPFAVLFFFINMHLYGGLFRSGYYYSKEEVFAISYLIKHLPSYILVLCLVYPLMLPISFLNKDYARFNLAFLSVLILYSASKNTLFEGEIIDLVKGIRFLVPVIPLLMLGYFEFISKKFSKFNFSNLLILLAFIALLGLTFMLNFTHQKFLIDSQTHWIDLRTLIIEK